MCHCHDIEAVPPRTLTFMQWKEISVSETPMSSAAVITIPAGVKE
jgi:hypothetical protein